MRVRPKQELLDCFLMTVQFSLHKNAETIVRVETILQLCAVICCHISTQSLPPFPHQFVLKVKHLILWKTVYIYPQNPR